MNVTKVRNNKRGQLSAGVSELVGFQ